jgi:hypothetical protein
MEESKKKLVVARSWRTFENQQVVAIANLVDKFSPHFDIEFFLCINDPDADIEYYMKVLTKAGYDIKVSFITNDALDEYAISKGASPFMVKEFKKWQWIYHILLYHQLYHEMGIDYILSYDDDIFFQGNPKEVFRLLQEEVPFAIQDRWSDSDKCMMGKLVEYFGSALVDRYYECYGSAHSSNSGFMGLNIKKIFSNFAPGHEFYQMLGMFLYEPYEHGGPPKEWKEYRILLQEQSFLSILSRATSNKKHILLMEEDGYSIGNIELSMVQHYTGETKYQSEFLDRVYKSYRNILKK